MSAWKIHYNCLFEVPYDNYGCFPHNEGTYNNAETINLPLMHVGYCVAYCFAMNYPLASLGGNANRYVDKFHHTNQNRYNTQSVQCSVQVHQCPREQD